MKLVRVGVLVGLAAVQGLVFAGAAHAAATSVQVVQGELLIRSPDQTDNRINVVTRDGKVHVFDSAPLTAGQGCEQVNPSLVACRAAAISSVRAWLGDGHDQGTFLISLPVKVDGGNGNDTITGGQSGDTLSGNDGNDVIKGGLGEDTIHGGAGLDYLQGEGDKDTLDDLRTGTIVETNKFDGGLGDDTIIGTGNDMRDMVLYPRSAKVVVNLSPVDYQGTVAGEGGQVNLGERDQITGVLDIHTGTGINDVLIAPTPYGSFDSGGSNNDDQCGHHDGNGFVLKLC